jgi:hypothetical protein
MSKLTLFRTLEAHIELLHVVVDQCDFVVAHQHLHDVRLDSALWTGHVGLCVIVFFLREGGMLLNRLDEVIDSSDKPLRQLRGFVTSGRSSVSV